mgnify:CR=1 FL=1
MRQDEIANKNKFVVSFRFSVSFGNFEASFKEISGIAKELRVEEVVCGGQNNFKYKLPTIVSNKNLVLKRAIVLKDSGLYDWCSETLDNNYANGINTKNVTVRLLNPSGAPVWQWLFYNAYPINYSVSDFNSQESTLVIESIELAYNYFDLQ